MKFINLVVLLYFGIIFSCYAGAVENSEDSNPSASEYLSPDQMTEDDYAKLSEYSSEYDSCLNEESRIQLNNFDDPRHVVDTAMKKCAFRLEELNVWMQDRNFPPGFIHKYIQKTSNKTVNKVLPSVMMAIAARRSESAENN